jgi:adenylosuccinate synthase
MINGVTELSMMKADILSIFDSIKICTHYEIDGQKITEFPYDVHDVPLVPIYIEMAGWKEDLTKLRKYQDAPQELKNYVLYLEKELNVPITLVSVGPDREQTLLK